MVRRSIHSVTTATGHAVPASKARQTSHAVRSGLLALEPRLLFDGAIGATADAAGDAGAHDFADAGAVAPTAAPVADTLPSPDEPTIAPKWATEPAPNSAPVANPDLRDVPYDAGQLWGNVITGGAPGDVADYDPDGDAFAVFGVTPGDTQQVPIANVGQPLAGEHGSLVLYDDGSYSYVPDASVAQLAPGESAQDVFSYLVCDIEGNISTTTLTIRYSNDAAPEPTPCPPPAPEPGPGPAPEPGPTPVPGPGPAPEPGPTPAPGPGPAPEPGPAPVPGPGPTPVEPPVVVAPPAPQPVLPVPLPPVSGDPDFGGVQPQPPLSTIGDPSSRALDGFTLLAPDTAAPAAIGPSDLFAPFAPASVLGMVETSPARDAKLADAKIAPVSDAQEAAPIKPKVVKRVAVVGDGAEPNTNGQTFSEKVREQAKGRVPAQPARPTGASKG